LQKCAPCRYLPTLQFWSKYDYPSRSSCPFFINILFLLSKWFQTRRCLWEFPIGSYVKLSSAVAAILVDVLKCGTQFWKRTTQESFQKILVEIGSVVSEEKIFFNCSWEPLVHLIFTQNTENYAINLFWQKWEFQDVDLRLNWKTQNRCVKFRLLSFMLYIAY
jgi:hypothetical protein